MSSSLLDAALAYARAGWSVFPLDGKVPRTKNGHHDATRDEATIHAWWAIWPDANVGARMGQPWDAGFLVCLDVDPRNGGWSSFDALEKNGNTFPATREHDSGGCADGEYGRHLFYVAREPMADGKLAPGIDVKGSGYVVLPPSVHPDTGEAYAVADDRAPSALPAWIALQLQAKRTTGFAPTPIDVSTDEGRRRLRLGEEAAKTFEPSRADGQGGRRLFALCLRLVRGLELPLDCAQELVEQWFNPRCTESNGSTPYPWTTEEIRHKLEDARDRSDAPTGVLSEATEKGIEQLAERLSNPHRMPIPPPAEAKPKDKVGADRAYDGERVKLTVTALTRLLYDWPAWKDVFWFDVLAQKPHATDPPVLGKMTLEGGELSRGDFAQIRHWLDVHGFLASKEMIEEALWTVVRQPDRQRNLIVEYLDALPAAEDSNTLDTLATDVFGCTDPAANIYLKKTLVAAVRRARNPGHFHKSMLVLKGEQQCGKTPAVKILAGPWYYSTGNGNLADRDTILECQGKWLVEVEELSALGKADADALKTAISRTHDVITKKYEPDGKTYPRSFVLVGTTNKDEFLTDATGNARYWVIECGQIDLDRLEQVRDRVWAEADMLASTTSSDSNELDVEERAGLEERNKSYLNTHPWLDDVAAYVRGKKEVTSASEILLHILKGDMTKADKRAKNEVADLLRTLGCTKVRVWRDGKTVKLWTVPETLSTAAPARANATVTRLRPAGR